MNTSRSCFPCQLSGPDRNERARAWRSLVRLAVQRDRTEAGFRIVFDDDALEQLEALVSAERSCCGWATWSATSDPPYAVLDVTGPSEPLAALATAFGL
jgi:hypothetical protein